MHAYMNCVNNSDLNCTTCAITIYTAESTDVLWGILDRTIYIDETKEQDWQHA